MDSTSSQDAALREIGGDYQFGFRDEERPVFKTRKGLDHEIIDQISDHKSEPDWMRKFRHDSLNIFLSKPMPTWGGPSLKDLNFDDIYYYLKPVADQGRTWDEVPADIKRTFDRLGIPEAERTVLAGVGAQYESEVVYHSLKKEWEDKGVIFMDTDMALRECPKIFREYWATVIPPADNKLAALNSAVWSGGSFIYIPKGVKVDVPLQAYFRINAEKMGQFERTLIIVDEGAQGHYIEGCTAPTYSSDSLHSAVVEIIVKDRARFRYSTIQNWSANVYNLVTKRAVAHADATMEWIDGNLGSKLTMKYPAIYLVGERAHGEVLSVAFAKDGQHQDAGAKVVHVAPNTTSQIISKSISKGLGRSSYRGLCKVLSGAIDAKSSVQCDALLLDEASQTDTFPNIEIEEKRCSIGHEASVSKISEEQLFYLMSRGIGQDEAKAMIVRGFIEPIARELPLEYAVELNRLIQLEMEGTVG